MKDTTEIAIILDKSGSMGALATDTIGTFNTFLREQKVLPGEANISLILFNSQYFVKYLSKPIAKAEELDASSYIPGGFTSLLDAVGYTIDSLGESLAKRAETDRPSKVIVVIITDGLENSSREYTLEQVKSRILHQQNVYKWLFLFLGADIDTFTEARRLGIRSGNIGRFTTSVAGTRSVGQAVSRGITEYRENGQVSMDWNKELK